MYEDCPNCGACMKHGDCTSCGYIEYQDMWYDDSLTSIRNSEYRALKRAEKALEEFKKQPNLVNPNYFGKVEIKNPMDSYDNTPDTLRHVALNDDDSYTRQVAMTKLTDLEKPAPNELDNSLFMDVPEEIREAAKKAGLGVENLADLITQIKREDRVHQRDVQDTANEHESRHLREARKNMRLAHAHTLATSENTIAHNEASLELQQDHEFRMQKLRNHDNANKREAKIRIAQIKGQVKIKNEHGVSVGEDRWNAAKTLAKSVGWTAVAGSLAFVAYQVAGMLL